MSGAKSGPRLGILISGRGSNMAAILKAIEAGTLGAIPAVVLSHNPKAEGLVTAAQQDIPTFAELISEFDSKEAYEAWVVGVLKDHQVDLVILAGYMRLVGPTLLAAFPNRILNIHPSYLPAFKGLHAQRQAVEAGAKESGCSVHVVDDTLDGGPLILQTKVPVLPGDTEASLSERILVQEHQLYPKAIAQYWEKENNRASVN
ncbi:MAG: phosphoribosylglycinamide formyltransferase [Candidatus Margulisiibacteriota bacterium]